MLPSESFNFPKIVFTINKTETVVGTAQLSKTSINPGEPTAVLIVIFYKIHPLRITHKKYQQSPILKLAIQHYFSFPNLMNLFL